MCVHLDLRRTSFCNTNMASVGDFGEGEQEDFNEKALSDPLTADTRNGAHSQYRKAKPEHFRDGYLGCLFFFFGIIAYFQNTAR